VLGIGGHRPVPHPRQTLANPGRVQNNAGSIGHIYELRNGSNSGAATCAAGAAPLSASKFIKSSRRVNIASLPSAVSGHSSFARRRRRYVREYGP
jgi:hypothetical protein